MLLTTKIKLLPNDEQYQQLRSTMTRFNEACNHISAIAFRHTCFSKVHLQKLCYYDVREAFGLSAQLVIRAIAKVCESYKVNRNSQAHFRLDGAIVYDERILSFKGLELASITTLEGRIHVPMVISSYHKGVLEGTRVRGQADLIFDGGTFYLLLVIEMPEGTPLDTNDVIGIDLGIANIAADHTGQLYSGAKMNHLRKRYARIRAKLQAKQTKSAKRLLKRRAKKEQRMARDTNHRIAKEIVQKAVRHSSAIALEDLNGLSKQKQKSKTVHPAQRKAISRWAFHQLRTFIEYKAKQAGVPIVFVDPKFTSQTCAACGHVDKESRKTQRIFECTSCGTVAHADVNASLNIRAKGERQLAIRRSA